jgi:uncharacterized protein YdhG (YjbR/CyaY superfamily)
MHMKKFRTNDEYIAAAPERVRPILEKIRAIIRKAAPKAEEKIGYGIPSFLLNGRPLMYFAAFKNHVSVYPIPSGPAEFRKEIRPHVKGKGTIQFPLDRPVPYGLVKRVAELHVKAHSAEP